MTKSCNQDHHCKDNKKLYKRLFAGFLIFIILISLTILIIWLVLRPTKPRFTLQDVSVVQFNITSPNFVSSVLQVTVASRNPNDHIGVYYDEVSVYAVYGNQQITGRTGIPPTYQGHNDINVWSPFISGNNVPIAPYLDGSLSQDINVGFAPIFIKMEGRVKWKVGTWTSGNYHLHVSCPALLTFEKRDGNGIVTNARLQLGTVCHSDV